MAIDMIVHTYLWYLPYLFVYYVIALMLKRQSRWAICGTFLVVAVVGPDKLESPFFYGAFFAGWALVPYLPRFIAAASGRAFWGMLAVAAASMLGAAFVPTNGPWLLLYWVNSMLGISGLLALSVRISSARFSRILAWFGTSSIVVYVTHPVLLGMISMILPARLEPEWQVWLLVAGTLIGVTFLVLLQKHTGFRYAFVLPAARKE